MSPCEPLPPTQPMEACLVPGSHEPRSLGPGCMACAQAAGTGREEGRGRTGGGLRAIAAVLLTSLEEAAESPTLVEAVSLVESLRRSGSGDGDGRPASCARRLVFLQSLASLLGL